MGLLGCKGLCERSKWILSLSEIRRTQWYIYENGVSYCGKCEKYMRDYKRHCFCCGAKKRYGPRAWDCLVKQRILNPVVRY